MAKSKYGKISSFIKENSKDTTSDASSGDEIKLQVTQADYQEAMNELGVPKDVLKQVAEANTQYYNGNVEVLAELLKKNKDARRAVINTRTPGGVIQMRMTRSNDVRSPQTGETMTKYGSVSMKLAAKSKLDKELLQRAAKEIEETCSC